MSAPGITKARAATLASSDYSSAFPSTSSLTVPHHQHDRDIDPEIDIALWFMAAVAAATPTEVLDVAKDVKASDLGASDADIYAAAVALAHKGVAPTVTMLYGQLEREGMFADHKGRARARRMLDMSTLNASPLQLRQYGLILVEASFKRAVLSMSEGIFGAWERYSIREIMPYVIELGTNLSAINQRRIALGGERL